MRRSLILLAIAISLSVQAAAQHDHHHEAGEENTLGRVSFPTSCSAAVQTRFNSGVAMLHSFWYEQAADTFEKVAKAHPKCAMAHWGMAMAGFHQLWDPPVYDVAAERQQLTEAKQLAVNATERERSLIDALGQYFADPVASRADRAAAYADAMAGVYAKFPKDDEIAVFYALSLIGTASPTDKTYAVQKKAAEILNAVLKRQPRHPGIAHYMIHSYDYPELANLALPAARSYAQIAPAVPHAQHMPSHIFVRLGLWQEAAASNDAAAKSARAYGAEKKMAGAWDQQLHAMDYLIYAYLQMNDEKSARAIAEELNGIGRAEPEKSLSAQYAFAAIPARFAVERGDWNAAARLSVRPSIYPGVEAITYLARVLGKSRLGDIAGAKADLDKIEEAHRKLVASGDKYWATQVEIQKLEAQSWIAWAESRHTEAVAIAKEATELESKTDKLNVTPGVLIPAQESLAAILIELKRPQEALAAFQASLQVAPGRRAPSLGIEVAQRMIAANHPRPSGAQ